MNKSEKKEPSKAKMLTWDEMSNERMTGILLELEDTPYWQAILRYIHIRSDVADDALRQVDVFKEPTKAARTQGIRAGLWDVHEFIAKEKEARENEDKGK